MKFLLENWLPLLPIIACLAMHLLGHRHRRHQGVPVEPKRNDQPVQRGTVS